MKPGWKIVLWLGALGVLYFAIEGGEWGTYDLLRQGSRKARLAAEVDSLERAVDSLTAYRQRLATDVKLQERIAREEYGMVRGEKEILYRFVEPSDSARERE